MKAHTTHTHTTHTHRTHTRTQHTHTDHEAMQGAVVGVQQEGGEGTHLRRAVPAIRAVHQHTHTLVMECLAEAGKGGEEGRGEEVGREGRGGRKRVFSNNKGYLAS